VKLVLGPAFGGTRGPGNDGTKESLAGMSPLPDSDARAQDGAQVADQSF
jgi:hypothetical protein